MGNPARLFLEAFAMITINVNFLKAALLFASDEGTRYYLKGVHLLRRGRSPADHRDGWAPPVLRDANANHSGR
jgi:hypothetical protein